MIKRAASTLVGFVLILTAPYWVYMPAILVLIFTFPFYWEGIILAHLIDSLYAPGRETLPLVFIAVVLVFVSEPLRERLRFS